VRSTAGLRVEPTLRDLAGIPGRDLLP
jgi:hypothetical protein